jgi:hypothetical protein
MNVVALRKDDDIVVPGLRCRLRTHGHSSASVPSNRIRFSLTRAGWVKKGDLATQP